MVPEIARLTVQKEGYEPDQVFELDARAPPEPEPPAAPPKHDPFTDLPF